MVKGRTKRLTPIEQNELTSELNEMFLDQLMSEFCYERNTLQDKVDFIKNMLYYYQTLLDLKKGRIK